MASTAPAYSLAASLGLVVATGAGLKAPAIMLLAFIPMYFIAVAYKELNEAEPDCGTTFTWATRAFGPIVGWMGGWGIREALAIDPSGRTVQKGTCCASRPSPPARPDNTRQKSTASSVKLAPPAPDDRRPPAGPVSVRSALTQDSPRGGPGVPDRPVGVLSVTTCRE